MEFEQLLALLCFSHWIDTPIYESGREWGAQEGGGGHIKQLEMEAHCSKNRNIKKNIKAQGMQSSKKKKTKRTNRGRYRKNMEHERIYELDREQEHPQKLCMYVHIHIYLAW